MSVMSVFGPFFPGFLDSPAVAAVALPGGGFAWLAAGYRLTGSGVWAPTGNLRGGACGIGWIGCIPPGIPW